MCVFLVVRPFDFILSETIPLLQTEPVNGMMDIVRRDMSSQIPSAKIRNHEAALDTGSPELDFAKPFFLVNC